MTSTDAPSADLLKLAEAHGVAGSYSDWQGRDVIVTRNTLARVLVALGVDLPLPAGEEGPGATGSGEADVFDAAVSRALQAVAEEPWRRGLPPTTVVRESVVRAAGEALLSARVPAGADVVAELVTEDGERLALVPAAPVGARAVDGVDLSEVPLPVPADLPVGYHRVLVRVDGGDGDGEAPWQRSGAVIVVPDAMPAPVTRERLWGPMTQLYQLRSSVSWGHGDLADLAELAGWAARRHGADFVLVNPLHAPDPAPPVEASPYLPSSRRFMSPLYLRIEDIRETAYLSAADRAIVEWHAEEMRATNRSDSLLDRNAVWEAKLAALERVYAVPRSPSRQASLDAFVAAEGDGLQNWATWCALRELYEEPPSHWPEQAVGPQAPGLADLRSDLAERIQFHCWVQWLVDEQLARVQREAAAAGMSLGVVHDLAVGVHPDGAEAWGLQGTLAGGVTVGAPPDAFNQLGQDWSQPPWRPDALAEQGYAPYRAMLRSILRHSGGVRVDHVMGLFRLWWIPAGTGPAEGTYVRYDHEAMLGILLLEASRVGAVVIGEDLGVVEPWVREHLAERGVLGTSILWFEKKGEEPTRPREWRELCMATVATHDLPPAAGYLDGVHVDVRDSLGQLSRPVAEERALDSADRERFLGMLRELGLLAEDASEEETVAALHRMLTWTPARMVGVAVADLVGDRRPVNLPGTHDEYPNWRLPLTGPDGQPVLLEDLFASARAEALARVVAEGL